MNISDRSLHCGFTSQLAALAEAWCSVHGAVQRRRQGRQRRPWRSSWNDSPRTGPEDQRLHHSAMMPWSFEPQKKNKNTWSDFLTFFSFGHSHPFTQL